MGGYLLHSCRQAIPVSVRPPIVDGTAYLLPEVVGIDHAGDRRLTVQEHGAGVPMVADRPGGVRNPEPRRTLPSPGRFRAGCREPERVPIRAGL